MGLFTAINQWNTARLEQRSSHLRSQGICPECHSKGIYPMLNEFLSPLECTQCNGTGLLSLGTENSPNE